MGADVRDTIHPNTIMAVLRTLREMFPELSAKDSADLAVKFVERMGYRGIRLYPRVIDEPNPSETLPPVRRESPSETPSFDRFTRLFQEAARQEERAHQARGHAPWRSPELS